VITVSVPPSLLSQASLSPSAKVLWLASHLVDPLLPPALVAASGLSPTTIRRGMHELAAAGWPAGRPAPTRPTPNSSENPSIPAELLADPHIGAPAKLLYAGLQLSPAFRHRQITITYTDLCGMAHASRNTVKTAMGDLVHRSWLKVTQDRPSRTLHLEVLNPMQYRQRLEVAQAVQRLGKPGPGGEKLMREILSLLVATDRFTDDDAPGFMVNPKTGELLEFDRYYPDQRVAFEFNGAQHYGATDWFPDTEEAKDRQLRDMIKAGLCFYKGIRLVIVHAEDLSLETMQQKVGSLLPLRDLTGHDLLRNRLIKRCYTYRLRSPDTTPGASGP
jgi:hypothetical protein